MSIQAYQSLIDQLCLHAGIEHPASMYEGAEFAINDAKFMLCHAGKRAPHMAMVYCAFGPLLTTQRELALQRLLETNVVLFGTPGSPFFSYHPDSNEVLLNASLFLAEASGLRVLEMLTAFPVVAREWRTTYFLEENATARRAVASSNGALGARRTIARQFSAAVAAQPQSN